jgi:protein-disulfide isomerase
VAHSQTVDIGATNTPMDPIDPMDLSIEGSPSMGAHEARVTIVESIDFQCPYCARLSPTLDRLVALYPRDVRVVVKHNPLGFHKRAMAAAKAAMAAHLQGRFWGYHDLLFENQKTLEDEDLERFAKKLKLNMKRWRADKESPAVKRKILHDQASMVGHGARGTPACFINGKMVSGAKPLDAFKAEVEAALDLARAELAKGTKRAALHAVLATRQASRTFVKSVIKGGTPPKPPAPKPRRAQPDPTKRVKVNVHPNDPYIGRRNAPVVLVLFADFQ